MTAIARFKNLSCQERNDRTGAGSVTLLYDAELMWGPEDMTNGQTKSVTWIRSSLERRQSPSGNAMIRPERPSR